MTIIGLSMEYDETQLCSRSISVVASNVCLYYLVIYPSWVEQQFLLRTS